MNSKNNNNQNFEEFAQLIEELEAPETRPSTPNLAPDFKSGLRYKLLQEYKEQTLSRSETFNLWRFAGSAVALFVLIAAVALFWTAISNPNVSTDSAQDTVPAVTRTAVPADNINPQAPFAPSNVTSWSNTPANVHFGGEIALQSYEIVANPANLTITMSFQTLTDPAINYTVFSQLQDKNGVLISQSDTSLFPAEMSARAANQTLMVMAVLDTQNLPANGRYDIIIGLYNPETGQRYPVTADNPAIMVENQTAVWLTDWDLTEGVQVEMQSGTPVPYQPLTISGGRIFDLQIFTEPGGDVLVDVVIDDAIELLLGTPGPLNIIVVEGNVWVRLGWRELASQTVGSGWVEKSVYNRLVSFAHQLANAATQPEPGAPIWVVSTIQKQRPSASANIEWEIIVDYEYTGPEELFLKLLYAHPDWENSGDGRPPLDGLGDPVLLDPAVHEVTVTFTGNPQEMAQIVGTDHPVLVAQFGYFVDDGERGREFKLLDMKTLTDIPFDLTRAEESTTNHIPFP